MLKHSVIYILFICFSFYSMSCGNNPGDKALTKEDQKVFTDYFKFQPSPDIKNFYYFPDELGIDASYWISFECNESTMDSIRQQLVLQQEKKPQEGLIGGLNIEPTPWWDTVFIKKTKPYSRQKENLYWYLWYDKDKKKVYFLTFDT